MMRILSQGICVSDYHIVYFEYLRVVFVNYSSIKHKKKKKMIISHKVEQKGK